MASRRMASGGHAREQASPHERYFELCALTATGTLSDQEWEKLKWHLSQCTECRDLVQKYREIERSGMPLLMADESHYDPQEAWTPELAKRDLFARIARGEQVGWSSDAVIRARSSERRTFWTRLHFPSWQLGLRYAACAALGALLIVAVYRFGIQKGQEFAGADVRSAAMQDSALRNRLDALELERASLNEQAAERNGEIASMSRKVETATAEVAKLEAQQKESAQNLANQRVELSQANAVSASVAAERDALGAKLKDAEATLASMNADLVRLREQRTATLLYTTSLETRIGDLSARLKKEDERSSMDSQLLTSDRDIRELMGARDLYIADVFDVDPNGRTEKRFGRVFYTRGKSLIFYAFDLDQQRGARNVSTFQAWGRRGLHDAHPVNMGIFYLDNETNRRWVLKFDDPETLARIDQVFVTVEPQGGSEAPRGKALLVASLRSQPNHP